MEGAVSVSGASLRGNDQRPLFEPGFLELLRTFRLELDLEAVPEGTVVFPFEPLIRVQGPLWQAQLVETPLLNMVNFQSLIATKAARIVEVAGEAPVLEFGLRRAQGVDGALAASRASFIGGCAATSNTLAGKLFGIPVRGTHAHSWVMSFDSEEEAFLAYAQAMPNNCVFLVDTYDTLQGVQHAIQAGLRLRQMGFEMAVDRLDSGGLAYLSQEARKLLDQAGFPKAAIVASNDLDEHIIESLKTQGAAIALWGVGTKLVTGYDQPALGGVYKLGAIRKKGEAWKYRIKISEQNIKTTVPGILQVRRFRLDDHFAGDLIYDRDRGIEENTLYHPFDPLRHKPLPPDTPGEDLLLPVFRQGKRVYDPPEIGAVRRYAFAQRARLHPSVRRLVHPHEYPCGLERRLWAERMELIRKARNRPAPPKDSSPSHEEGKAP